MTNLRLALVAAALPLLSACSVTVPLDVGTQVHLVSPGGAVTYSQAVELSSYGDLWSHRNDFDSLSVDEVSVTVLSVGTGNPAATGSLTLKFRPEGAAADGSQDFLVGTVASLPLTVGSRASLPGSPALDTLLLNVLHGTGQFTVLASGAVASGPADATLEVRLKGSAVYKKSM